MKTLGLQKLNTSTQVNDSIVDHILYFLDQVRISILRLTMKNLWFRSLYTERAYRLGVNFVLFSVIYLLLSLKFSLVLLVLGPMILGYAHLIASYRFLQKSITDLLWQTPVMMRFFLFLSVGSLTIRFLLPQVFTMPLVPYGTWEMVLSWLAVFTLRLKLKSIQDWFVALGTTSITFLVLQTAWRYPMAFVGFALILHNWVAFGHWVMAAKDRRNLLVAILATLLFAFIHAAIFFGIADAWISIVDFSFLTTESFKVTGWSLAPWSNDPLVWNRFIVMYTFGLSLHYFVWLQAVPQCQDTKSLPNSFSQSWRQLQRDCGVQTTRILLLVGIIILGLWFFTNFAGRIYFGIAMLHGWLEFTFLILAFLKSIKF